MMNYPLIFLIICLNLSDIYAQTEPIHGKTILPWIDNPSNFYHAVNKDKETNTESLNFVLHSNLAIYQQEIDYFNSGIYAYFSDIGLIGYKFRQIGSRSGYLRQYSITGLGRVSEINNFDKNNFFIYNDISVALDINHFSLNNFGIDTIGQWVGDLGISFKILAVNSHKFFINITHQNIGLSARNARFQQFRDITNINSELTTHFSGQHFIFDKVKILKSLHWHFYSNLNTTLEPLLEKRWRPEFFQASVELEEVLGFQNVQLGLGLHTFNEEKRNWIVSVKGYINSSFSFATSQHIPSNNDFSPMTEIGLAYNSVDDITSRRNKLIQQIKDSTSVILSENSHTTLYPKNKLDVSTVQVEINEIKKKSTNLKVRFGKYKSIKDHDLQKAINELELSLIENDSSKNQIEELEELEAIAIGLEQIRSLKNEKNSKELNFAYDMLLVQDVYNNSSILIKISIPRLHDNYPPEEYKVLISKISEMFNNLKYYQIIEINFDYHTERVLSSMRREVQSEKLNFDTSERIVFYIDEETELINFNHYTENSVQDLNAIERAVLQLNYLKKQLNNMYNLDDITTKMNIETESSPKSPSYTNQFTMTFKLEKL